MQLFNEIEDYDRYYQDLHGEICGIDEVGRGPLFGPVVAAAVSLKDGRDINDLPKGISDSKRLTSAERGSLEQEILECCHVSYGLVPHDFIDCINILNSTMLAMGIAYRNLNVLTRKRSFALIDGNRIPLAMSDNATAIVKGDSRSKMIGAASIVAKEYRDRIMNSFESEFKGYDLAKNKGYGTLSHREAIKKIGISTYHRKSFLKKIAPIQTF